MSGIRPWSWYIQTNASIDCKFDSTNAVSGTSGPNALIPSLLAFSIAGFMNLFSSFWPNNPFSPPCGLRAKTPIVIDELDLPLSDFIAECVNLMTL